ncbi:hypothetical protein [Enterococcus sp. DIV0187]|uniref:hypothetical protein n=1 Tax=Enterococcus sp. DIV0187 TaxID=2774644 RepID=UPI003F22D123
MNEKLTISERNKLQQELNHIMMNQEDNTTPDEIKAAYDHAGEIMVKLNLLSEEHQHFPEIVARVYAHYLKTRIDKIVNKTRD